MNTLLAQLIIVTAQLRALRRLNLTIFLNLKFFILLPYIFFPLISIQSFDHFFRYGFRWGQFFSFYRIRGRWHSNIDFFFFSKIMSYLKFSIKETVCGVKLVFKRRLKIVGMVSRWVTS